jgi:hypothetical protein
MQAKNSKKQDEEQVKCRPVEGLCRRALRAQRWRERPRRDADRQKKERVRVSGGRVTLSLPRGLPYVSRASPISEST